MAQTDDPYDLARFVRAQEDDYAQALSELQAGRKRSHWIWYILPQLLGLGSSSMAVRYGITSLDEARAYLKHAVLGARLRECVAAINAHGDGSSAEEMLGSIDAQKFRSCLTLFIAAAEHDAPSRQEFQQALDRYYGGVPDQRTLGLLGRA
ncbi:MAG: DUF1810 domain-containing protein [Alphaproteobacteria bacterium]|nr:DUF1810 domain-containing protein [Alphaproteobacteria bacterium]